MEFSNKMRAPRRLPFVAGSIVSLVFALGCGGPPYEVAEVDGVVLIKGRPGNKIFIQFIPDVESKTSPPTSTAETDQSGRFTLQLMESPEGATQPGAVVGAHRVVLRDLQLAESATGAGVPIRLPQQFTLVGATPLKQEVKPGKQTIEIKVP
jgi:hypothetical protein